MRNKIRWFVLIAGILLVVKASAVALIRGEYIPKEDGWPFLSGLFILMAFLLSTHLGLFDEAPRKIIRCPECGYKMKSYSLLGHRVCPCGYKHK